MNYQNEIRRLERIAAAYTSKALAGANEQYHVYLRDALIPLEGGKSALEIGCGKGLWTAVLCDRYDVVDVVDGSQELLQEVDQANAGRPTALSTHCAMVEEFTPPAGRSWQHVYITFLLEHVVDPVAVLRKIHRLMEPDGHVFVAVPHADSLHRRLAVRMGLINSVEQLSENDRRVGHRRVYTRELLRAQLTHSGFRIVDEIPVGLKALSLAQMKNWSRELVWTLCASGDLAPDHAAYIVIRGSRV